MEASRIFIQREREYDENNLNTANYSPNDNTVLTIYLTSKDILSVENPAGEDCTSKNNPSTQDETVESSPVSNLINLREQIGSSTSSTSCEHKTANSNTIGDFVATHSPKDTESTSELSYPIKDLPTLEAHRRQFSKIQESSKISNAESASTVTAHEIHSRGNIKVIKSFGFTMRNQHFEMQPSSLNSTKLPSYMAPSFLNKASSSKEPLLPTVPDAAEESLLEEASTSDETSSSNESPYPSDFWPEETLTSYPTYSSSMPLTGEFFSSDKESSTSKPASSMSFTPNEILPSNMQSGETSSSGTSSPSRYDVPNRRTYRGARESSSLLRHVILTHSENNSIKCPLCPYKAKAVIILTRHINTMHLGKPY